MQILSLMPVANQGGGKMKHVADFDLQISDDILICGMRLLLAPDGRFLTYAPTAVGGRRSVTFAPNINAAITATATRYFQEHVTANDNSHDSATA